VHSGEKSGLVAVRQPNDTIGLSLPVTDEGDRSQLGPLLLPAECFSNIPFLDDGEEARLPQAMRRRLTRLLFGAPEAKP
jgi:hypothetical protein